MFGHILLEFLFRLTFGVAAAMACTSSRDVTSGFFRIHLWVLLGVQTLAALAAPLWHPPEHCTRWPPDEAYPARLRDMRAELGRWRARDHVLRMYRQHRAGHAASQGTS